MVPKTPIGCVDLRDVAEELLGINFTKYDIVLKITQTVEEELKQGRLTTMSMTVSSAPTYVLDHFQCADVSQFSGYQLPQGSLLTPESLTETASVFKDVSPIILKTVQSCKVNIEFSLLMSRQPGCWDYLLQQDPLPGQERRPNDEVLEFRGGNSYPAGSPDLPSSGPAW